MTVTDPRPLPLHVLEVLNQGRKVEAIKILRAEEGLDLRDAKERVEAHLASNPGVRDATVVRPAGAGRWVALLLVVVLLAVAVFVVAG